MINWKIPQSWFIGPDNEAYKAREGPFRKTSVLLQVGKQWRVAVNNTWGVNICQAVRLEGGMLSTHNNGDVCDCAGDCAVRANATSRRGWPHQNVSCAALRNRKPAAVSPTILHNWCWAQPVVRSGQCPSAGAASAVGPQRQCCRPTTAVQRAGGFLCSVRREWAALSTALMMTCRTRAASTGAQTSKQFERCCCCCCCCCCCTQIAYNIVQETRTLTGSRNRQCAYYRCSILTFQTPKEK